MSVELMPCPFCGVPGKRICHGYSDEYCSTGCVNDDCAVKPYAVASVKSYPWDESKTTYWNDWDEAEAKADEAWNHRTPDPRLEVAVEALERIEYEGIEYDYKGVAISIPVQSTIATDALAKIKGC